MAGIVTSRLELLLGLLKAWTPDDVLWWCAAETDKSFDADLASFAVHRIAKSCGGSSTWARSGSWDRLILHLQDTAGTASVPFVCKSLWALAKVPPVALDTPNFHGAIDALQRRAEDLAMEFDVQGVTSGSERNTKSQLTTPGNLLCTTIPTL